MKSILKDRRVQLGMFGIAMLLIVVGAIMTFVFLRKANHNFVIVVEGTASYKIAESQEYTKIDSAEAEFTSGTFIKTEKDSSAEIYLSDNSIISLDASTEIQVVSDNSGTSIDQLVGNTWHRVQSLGDSKKYEVKTPNTVASVRGTIFAVDVNKEENTSVVLVEENNVDVNECNNQKFNVGEGALARVSKIDDNCDSEASVTFDDLKKTNWYIRNKFKDKLFIELRNRKFKTRREFRQAFRERLLSDGIKGINNQDFKEEIYNQFVPTLTIESPKFNSQNKFSTTATEIKLAGKTEIINNVKINSENIDTKEGKFSKTIKLNFGENDVVIKSTNPITGRSIEKKVWVIRTEVVKPKPVVTQTPTVTPQPTPEPPAPKPASITLYGSSNDKSKGIDLSWTTQNLGSIDNFKFFALNLKTGASTTFSAAKDSSSYFWYVSDGNTYEIKMCAMVGRSCTVYSNKISVTAPVIILY
jgi:hypothetical protein